MMKRFGHIFTDVVKILFAILLLIMFFRHQQKDVIHNAGITHVIDSMYVLLKKQDSVYLLLSTKRDTITILREKIVTVHETNRINELKKELEYWKGRNSSIPVYEPQIKDPLELYSYFSEIIKSK